MKNIQKSIKISVLSIGLLLGFCAQAMGPKSLIPAKLTQSSAVDKAKTMAKTVVQKVGAVPLVATAAQAVGFVDPMFAMGIVAGKAFCAKSVGYTLEVTRKVPKQQDLQKPFEIKNPEVVMDEITALHHADQLKDDVEKKELLKSYVKGTSLVVPMIAGMKLFGMNFAYGVEVGLICGLATVMSSAHKMDLKDYEKKRQETHTPETMHDLVALQQDYDAIVATPEQTTALDVAPKD